MTTPELLLEGELMSISIEELYGGLRAAQADMTNLHRSVTDLTQVLRANQQADHSQAMERARADAELRIRVAALEAELTKLEARHERQKIMRALSTGGGMLGGGATTAFALWQLLQMGQGLGG